MANSAKRVDFQNLVSLADDLLGVLKNKKDGDGLVQSLEGAILLQSSCQSDVDETGRVLEDYENKIEACKEKIAKSKEETDLDAELEHLQHGLDEKLQEEHLLRQELRAISEELIGFEHQRISIEERTKMIKKREKDLTRTRNLLSLCASVTNIIPDFEDTTKISGVVVDRNKKKAEKFEFEMTEAPLDICNKLWKMA
ncbi:kinetochore protein SPC24 homolog [Musa acuminata AAA Group]|uniref:kinetochore protein SPC24 homolog n=1 Tax=Musa acuminata AAA Group TaxID=214697 RepID=UPI0031DE8585